jgi:hypothetical protein
MILKPVDPNERFRARRRQARRRVAIRRTVALGVVVLAAGGIALGARSLGGGGTTVDGGHGTTAHTPASATAFRPRPSEMRGVHVTMALASRDGRLAQYMDMSRQGLNTIELDVKDENGQVGFVDPEVPLAAAVGAARRYYDARAVARAAHARRLYLIGRVVVFEDPLLARARPDLAIQRSDGSVWTTASGLGWVNQYQQKVWQYNVDVAAAAATAGFDEIMFDYVRFPTDGDVAAAVWPGKRGESRADTIAAFLRYARSRLHPLHVRVGAAVSGLSAERDMGIGQRPRLISRYVDTVYPMVYPSHYGAGEYGLDDPNSQPGRVVSLALRGFVHRLHGRGAALVPWLEDFSLGRAYTYEDVLLQIQAARNRDTAGYLLWNPDGVYTPGTLLAR